MYETDADIAWLQGLLDRSYESAGEHLRSITTPERRIPADELGGILTGMVLLNLATVTAAGEPRVGPVDGLFFRGRFHFSSSLTSVRYRHLVARPQVSASHTRGEELSVVVHGTAELFSFQDPDASAFRDYANEVYVPLYGDMWMEMVDSDDVFSARIEPARMYTFRMSPTV
jgi:hypothetical protein